MIKILIIEDQEKLRRSLMNIFKQEGFTICDGIQWERADKLLEKGIYDLIIVDLYAKPSDGYGMMKAIKFSHSSAEVITIIPRNGYDINKMTNYGIYDYILKPFHKKDLIEKVKKALEKKQLADKVRNLEQIMNDG